MGRHQEAEQLCRGSLADMDTMLGRMHPSTLLAVRTLAEVLQKAGKYQEAEELLRRAITSCEASLGPNHTSTLTAMDNLAGLLQQMKRRTEAEPVRRRVVEGREAALGPAHPETLRSLRELAALTKEEGGLQAVPLFELLSDDKNIRECRQGLSCTPYCCAVDNLKGGGDVEVKASRVLPFAP